jgi:hypothetical protein
MIWWLPNFGGFHGATANGGLCRFDFGLIQTSAVRCLYASLLYAWDNHQPYGRVRIHG